MIGQSCMQNKHYVYKDCLKRARNAPRMDGMAGLTLRSLPSKGNAA